MKLSIRGWSRDHGSTTLLNRSLKKAVSGPIDQKGIGLEVEADDEQTASENRIDIYFHTNARLGGDYMTKLSLNFEEVDKLYAATLAHRTSAEAHKSLSQFLD